MACARREPRPSGRCCSKRSITPCARRCTSGGCRAAARSSSRRRIRPRGRPGRELDITRARSSSSSRSMPLAVSLMGSRAGCCDAPTAPTEWMVFDRPAGSERDLVVLADVFEATIVQRHPAGPVRVVGSFGVLRWEGFELAPRTPGAQLDRRRHRVPGARRSRRARGACWSSRYTTSARWASARCSSIGPIAVPGPPVEERLPPPPPLRIRRATHLAPLRHALAQIDGAAIFDAEGVLRRLGVRLVPSVEAEGDRRRVRRHAPHVGPPLQLRRPARHRDRGQRGRPGVGVPQRRRARPLAAS